MGRPPSGLNWNQFQNDCLWSHNVIFDASFFRAYGLPLPGREPNCSANLSAWNGSPRALDKAARMLLPDAPAMSKDVRRSMKGRAWRDLSEDEKELVRAYALNDARMAHQIVSKYADGWPAQERNLSRHTFQMCLDGIGIDA
jgi:hypothetical protein